MIKILIEWDSLDDYEKHSFSLKMLEESLVSSSSVIGMQFMYLGIKAYNKSW